eukprot:8642366-Pyramimonas_sp.AAC.1
MLACVCLLVVPRAALSTPRSLLSVVALRGMLGVVVVGRHGCDLVRQLESLLLQRGEELLGGVDCG